MKWQPIETAPKGGGAEFVTDPAWVNPPSLLLYCASGDQVVAAWDWYYAEGGNGFGQGSPWRIASGESVTDCYTDPTHWMPLPPPPEEET
jgi:hypothetical protein